MCVPAKNVHRARADEEKRGRERERARAAAHKATYLAASVRS